MSNVKAQSSNLKAQISIRKTELRAGGRAGA